MTTTCTDKVHVLVLAVAVTILVNKQACTWYMRNASSTNQVFARKQVHLKTQKISKLGLEDFKLGLEDFKLGFPQQKVCQSSNNASKRSSTNNHYCNFIVYCSKCSVLYRVGPCLKGSFLVDS